jgi:hypothetical protein
LYSSTNIIVVINSRTVRWARYSACMGEMICIGSYKDSIGKPGGKRQLERQERRWKDNIYNCLKEIGRIVSCEFNRRMASVIFFCKQILIRIFQFFQLP